MRRIRFRPHRIPERRRSWRVQESSRRRQRPPGGPGPGSAPPPGPREYTVTEIPGVIAAGQQWKFVWQQLGNNGDGIIGSPDGGLLIAQNDSSAVVKLDKNGHPSVVYSDTNTGGALSMNSKGDLFIVERGVNPSVTELAPARKTIADKFRVSPWTASAS